MDWVDIESVRKSFTTISTDSAMSLSISNQGMHGSNKKKGKEKETNKCQTKTKMEIKESENESENVNTNTNNENKDIKNKYCEYCLVDDFSKVCLDDGYYSCTKCNTITDRQIDTNAEWRYYGHDDNKHSDPTRCGLPSNHLLPDSSLGTMIGFGTHETYAIRMMRKYNMWNSMTYKERTLYNIFDTLTINAVNSGIPKSILEESKMLYKQVSETCISRGDNRNGLIASCIYMACKNNKVPRSAKEIAKVFNLKVTTMTRGCKLFQDLMKVNVDSTTADDFVNRFCSSLQMSAEMRDICKKTVHIAEEMSYVSENTPPSIASAIIYFCNETYQWNMSKKLIAESCDISQVTMVKCYKKLIPFSDVLKQLPAPVGDHSDSITSSSN